MNIKKGQLLVAEPYLGDPNFERSVILLCEYAEEGAFGLVLNQVSNLTIEEAVEDCHSELPLYVGGPVEHNTLHYIHRLGDQIPNSKSLGNGIYWTGDFEILRQLLNAGAILQNDIRFFVGYAGWGEGQLDNELKKNSWIVTNADADMVFDSTPEEFWRKVLRNMGGAYKVMSNYPSDPRLN